MMQAGKGKGGKGMGGKGGKPTREEQARARAEAVDDIDDEEVKKAIRKEC